MINETRFSKGVIFYSEICEVSSPKVLRIMWNLLFVPDSKEKTR